MDGKTFTELTRPWYSKAVGFPFSFYHPLRKQGRSKTQLMAQFISGNITDSELETLVRLLPAKGENPLHQFPCSKSVASPQHKRQVRKKSITSCHGQKSVVSVVSCRFPNSITTTCCGLVGHVANKSVTSWQLLPSLQGTYEETLVIDFRHVTSFLKVKVNGALPLWNIVGVLISLSRPFSLYRYRACMKYQANISK